MLRKLLKYSYIGLILLFLYLPIIVIIIFSFNGIRNQTIFSGFSLQWYKEIFESRKLMEAIKTSISISIIATIVSTTIGTFAAIGIFYMGNRLKNISLTVNNIPILNPDIVTGLTLMMLFGIFTITRGYMTMLMAHIMFSIPFVILAIMPKLRQLNKHMLEAALDLGAKPFGAIIRVIIPNILPGIIVGALIAFTMSIDDFVISYFTTGDSVENISIWIYSQSKRGVSPAGNAVFTIMVVIIMSSLLLYNLYSIKKQKRKLKLKGEIK